MKEQILEVLETHEQISMSDLAMRLEITSAEEFKNVVKAISKMESKRLLKFSNDGNISLRRKKKEKVLTVPGVFHAHKKGFGFVSLEGEEEDLFVGRNDVGYAIDGDKVAVVITKPADRLSGTAAEARIVDILDHPFKVAVGKLILDDEKPKYAGYIRSRNPKIQQKIYVRKEPVVLEGTEIVKVAIEKYPTRHHDYFVASVRAIVGHQDDVGIDVLEVLESMDIVWEFPADVLAEAQAISDLPSAEDLIGRVDLREELTFTIDGSDAKDLDDAVHIKPLDNGNVELGVHIADVSYYVTEGSALDREAVSRGTSVYVTDRVVPMLPERLSNGICSLNPNCDRLTQSALMEIDKQGRLVQYQITQTVINTAFRMTYSDVNALLAGDEELRVKYDKIEPSIRHMANLHRILEAMREKRGSLNFDTSEAKILVNAKGLPVDIQVRSRGIAERMIESFMLAANECVAKHFAKRQLPFIYRIHEEPKSEKLQTFMDYASIFGVKIKGTASKVSQSALQDFMKKIEGQPGSEVLSMMLLRSMQQARYSEHNHGHYGLAADFYTHFTSPIRRYPDLLVHRLIREYDQITDEKVEHFAKTIPDIASSSSTLERRAVDAERMVEAMKKAEYMEKHIGEEFEGIISSVVKFGIFVELPNTIEGLIHVTRLPEFYVYNERTLTLQGEKSGKVFRVGQQIKVVLTRSDKATGEIDFDYLASDFDVIEKRSHSSKKSRSQDTRQSPNKKKTKGKTPFYKATAKTAQKGGKKHGKGRGQGRRTK